VNTHFLVHFLFARLFKIVVCARHRYRLVCTSSCVCSRY